MQILCSGIESAHSRVNLFSFKIEEIYTLTTFVDRQLHVSLSVYSKLTYDTCSLVRLGFFDLSKLLKKKNTGLAVI